jgi:multidrug efflux pump subunit AcrA (membrane-fusion protein)
MIRSFQASVTAVGSTVANQAQAAVSNVDLSRTTSTLNKTFSQLQQTVKERTGGANLDITELPQEYLDLERRVDDLKSAHTAVLRVTKSEFNLTLSLSRWNESCT